MIIDHAAVADVRVSQRTEFGIDQHSPERSERLSPVTEASQEIEGSSHNSASSLYAMLQREDPETHALLSEVYDDWSGPVEVHSPNPERIGDELAHRLPLSSLCIRDDDMTARRTAVNDNGVSTDHCELAVYLPIAIAIPPCSLNRNKWWCSKWGLAPHAEKSYSAMMTS
jgi:hypothetical protein